ncbi:MAG: choice-of-anchor D domain-containing protein [Candidatus Acidiferrales bacterium]
MALRGDLIQLSINDSAARYRIVVDPLLQGATLSASDGDTSIANSIAISADGSTIVAGAPEARSVSNGVFTGAAYVFERQNGVFATGTEVRKLIPADGKDEDEFGIAVAVSSDGSVIVVGADEADSEAGTAYAFVRPGASWGGAGTKSSDAKLNNLTGASNDRFGLAVAVSRDGNVAVVGAHENNFNQGAVYVFLKGSAWTGTKNPSATLKTSDQEVDDLGISLATNTTGSVIAAGAPGDNGAVYVFVEPNGGWKSGTETAQLFSGSGNSRDELGSSVSMNDAGNLIVTSAPNFGENAVPAGQPIPVLGRGFVFVQPGAIWVTTGTPNATLTGIIGGAGRDDLAPVSMSGDGKHVLMGAANATVGANDLQGVALLFDMPVAGWSGAIASSAQLKDAGGVEFENFGFALALNSDASIAAIGVEESNNARVGTGFVFAGPVPCAVSLSPSTFDFGSVKDGTGSDQPFTLSNGNCPALNNIVLSVTGTNSADFTQTHTCGASLAANTSCSITVTFKPSAAGGENATLQVADSDASSPQHATLSGTGTSAADFSIGSTAAAPPSTAGSTNSATVAAGATATFGLAFTSTGGFNTPVALSASFNGGTPTGAAANFTVTPVTPTAGGAASTLTITTTANAATAAAIEPVSRTIPPVSLTLILAAAGLLFARQKTAGRLVRAAAALGIVCVVLAGAGCTHHHHNQKNTGTPAGTYTIAISANGGGVIHAGNVTLIVQ